MMIEVDGKAVDLDLRPGDIGLCSNPADIGKAFHPSSNKKAINLFQNLEDGDKKSIYGHAFILAKALEESPSFAFNGDLYESAIRISKSTVSKYEGMPVCFMRHRGMTAEAYTRGIPEVLNNIGQIYPFHRLLFCAADSLLSWCGQKMGQNWKFRTSKLLKADWPVCSELAAQFILACGLETGVPKEGWIGVNPDDLADAREARADIWETVFTGKISHFFIV